MIIVLDIDNKIFIIYIATLDIKDKNIIVYPL